METSNDTFRIPTFARPTTYDFPEPKTKATLRQDCAKIVIQLSQSLTRTAKLPVVDLSPDPTDIYQELSAISEEILLCRSKRLQKN